MCQSSLFVPGCGPNRTGATIIPSSRSGARACAGEKKRAAAAIGRGGARRGGAGARDRRQKRPSVGSPHLERMRASACLPLRGRPGHDERVEQGRAAALGDRRLAETGARCEREREGGARASRREGRRGLDTRRPRRPRRSLRSAREPAGGVLASADSGRARSSSGEGASEAWGGVCARRKGAQRGGQRARRHCAAALLDRARGASLDDARPVLCTVQRGCFAMPWLLGLMRRVERRAQGARFGREATSLSSQEEPLLGEPHGGAMSHARAPRLHIIASPDEFLSRLDPPACTGPDRHVPPPPRERKAKRRALSSPLTQQQNNTRRALSAAQDSPQTPPPAATSNRA